MSIVLSAEFVDLSTYLGIAASGMALGFFLAYLRCRTRTGDCGDASRIKFRTRLATLAWTIAGGVGSTIAAHLLMLTSIPDLLVEFFYGLPPLGLN